MILYYIYRYFFRLIKVPKSWFLHFYIFSSVYTPTLLFLGNFLKNKDNSELLNIICIRTKRALMIGVLKCKFLFLRKLWQNDGPTNQPTDGHDGSLGSYTSNKDKIYIKQVFFSGYRTYIEQRPVLTLVREGLDFVCTEERLTGYLQGVS